MTHKYSPNSHPPPKAYPLIAAIMGFRTDLRAPHPFKRRVLYACTIKGCEHADMFTMIHMATFVSSKVILTGIQ